MSLINVKDRLWNGSINIVISYDDDLDEIKQFLLSVPRVSYLPIHFDDIITYFNHFKPLSGPIWLEYNSIPVKWNLPVGVIYDYYRIPNDSSKDLTLQLNLCTGQWPESLIPFNHRNQINYDGAMCDNFFNQLKQSNYVINGNSKWVMNLSKENSTRLWQSIKDHNLNDYQTINNKILPTTVSNFPVKVYIPGLPIIQLPIMKEGELKDLFSKYPSFIPYIHGIKMDELNMTVADLWKIFKYPDNFLYIVMI